MSIFHGSKVGDIKELIPKPHGAVDGESVVFGTPDKLFALAMIHGTGNQNILEALKKRRPNDRSL